MFTQRQPFKKGILLILLSFTLWFSVGCTPLLLPADSGTVVRREEHVASFAAVNLCCGLRLDLAQGEPAKVEIEGDTALLAEIELFVRNEELTVQLRPRFNLRPRLNNRVVTVYVTMPEIERLTFSGASRGKINRLTVSDLHLTLNGRSQLTIVQVVASTVMSELSGGSEVAIIDGTIATQRVDASGGSRYLLEQIQSERAIIDLSSNSRARISVNLSLRADASGGSDIAYHGTPALEQTISGGSRVRSLGR